MTSKKRVLFILTEMSPFIELSELSEFVSRLVSKLSLNGNEVRCIMPRFGIINERRYKLHEVVRLSGINITIDDEDYYLQIKVASLPNVRIQIYFLESLDFFKRKNFDRDDNNIFFEDNDLRSIFFCKGALEIVKKFAWAPDIVYCCGWMTSLIPMYIKTAFKKEPVFQNSKVVYNLSDLSFDESMGKNFVKKLKINDFIEKEHIKLFKQANNLSLQMGGISFADIIDITTFSIHKNVQKLLSTSIKNKIIIPFNGWDINYEQYIEIFEELPLT